MLFYVILFLQVLIIGFAIGFIVHRIRTRPADKSAIGALRLSGAETIHYFIKSNLFLCILFLVIAIVIGVITLAMWL